MSLMLLIIPQEICIPQILSISPTTVTGFIILMHGQDITLTQPALQAAEDKRLRKLIALRVIDQKFQDFPGKYVLSLYWRYADLKGDARIVIFLPAKLL